MTTSNVNAVKGKQGFQHRTHQEPTTSNLVSQDLGTVALDSRQQERLDLFLSKFPKNQDIGKTDDLEDFAIHYTIPEQIKSGRFFMDDGGQLHPKSVVFTRQESISKKRVLEYVDMMLDGDDLAEIQVTDIPPGGGHWHLNGLHRLIAARILGRSIEVEIWR